MSISSSLALLEPLDGQSWRDIQGFRIHYERGGEELSWCDDRLLDHIQGVCQRKLAERSIGIVLQLTSWFVDNKWRTELYSEEGNKVTEEDYYDGETPAESILAAYCACLQELA